MMLQLSQFCWSLLADIPGTVPPPYLLCVLCKQQHVCLAAGQPLHLLPQLLQPLLAALLHCCQPAVHLPTQRSSN
jgi:hypothetical protein